MIVYLGWRVKYGRIALPKRVVFFLELELEYRLFILQHLHSLGMD